MDTQKEMRVSLSCHEDKISNALSLQQNTYD